MPERLTPHEFKENQEARQKAEAVILQTLDLNPDVGLGNFPQTLKSAIMSLPQYSRFEKTMQNVQDNNLPYEVFKAIRKSNDEPVKAGIPTDGVLISSIRQGHTECAGRVAIASTYLQERNYPHTVVEAPSHSFLLLEQGEDTLAYCDPNNELFFTFPRAAMKGYKGTRILSECDLQEFAQRPTDIVDGLNTAYTHIITLPPANGVVSQYLDNVGAALAGNKEFKNTPIEKDPAAARAVSEIKSEILGEDDERLSEYFEQDTKMMAEIEQKMSELLHRVKDIINRVTNEEEFLPPFTALMQQQENSLFPYLKNASHEVMQNAAQKAWNMLKSR